MRFTEFSVALRMLFSFRFQNMLASLAEPTPKNIQGGPKKPLPNDKKSY